MTLHRKLTDQSPDFYFVSGKVALVPRATLVIDKQCPERYARIITQCYNNGWLYPQAYVPAHEEFMEKLTS